MSGKIKLLAWCDSPEAPTGFAKVAKYVLKALHDTGLYEIDVLAINWHGDFVDKDQFPYQLVPAKLLDPKDPYGLKMFARSMSKKPYDVVWIMNDTFVVQPVARDAKSGRSLLEKVRSEYRVRGLTPPLFVYYYPVDCKVVPAFSDMILQADVPVAYTEFGKQETLKALPEMAERELPIIYHGVDTSIFKPLQVDRRRELRKKYLNADDDTFVIVNVNRNSPRKQLPHTILAFKKFQEQVPDSVLYLHVDRRDKLSRIDLNRVLEDLELSPSKDVLFPGKMYTSAGFPEEAVNQYLSCSDAFLTTTLGEGFGLGAVESLAAGTTAIVPDNTVHSELFGQGERGIIYPCEDLIWADSQGFRKIGRIDTIVDALLEAKNENESVTFARRERSMEWCEEHTWDKIGQQWVKLIGESLSSKRRDELNQAAGAFGSEV